MGFHIEKRQSINRKKVWLIRGIAIVCAFIVCAVLTTVITGYNPLQVYATMISGAFGSTRKIFVTFQKLSVLLIISLALTPAFRMRFWNIGGEGQVLMGGVASAACMILLGERLSGFGLLLLMLVSSVVFGAVWGIIPALCKAMWNTNETLSTLMMNYIATQIVAFCMILWEVPKGSGTIGIINQATKSGWIPDFFGSKYIFSIIVAFSVTVGLYIYLYYTKHGFEISVAGSSENTARYVGIDVRKVILRTMFLSGGLCGLAGFLLVGGINHTLSTALVGGQGFTGVMVSWLAKFNPISMIFTSFLIVFMERGSGEISTIFSLNESFGEIMTGIIIFFIIGSEFFVNYRLFRKEK